MATTQTEDVRTTIEDRLLRIRFNRPKKKNAITRDMYSAMADAIVSSNSDPSVRVIVFEGTEGCFTSGNDLMDFMSAPDTGADSSVGRFLTALATAEKPVVAAVTGIAVGIGTTLLLHCDLVYASETAKFHLPFVNLGLVPEFGSSLILPGLMGHRRAAELLMLGQPFEATQAYDLGIVNAVVAADQVVPVALEKAQALVEQAPSALRQTKGLMKRGNSQSIAEQIAEEGSHFAAALTSPEAMEAFQAFMEKRKPDFSKFE